MPVFELRAALKRANLIGSSPLAGAEGIRSGLILSSAEQKRSLATRPGTALDLSGTDTIGNSYFRYGKHRDNAVTIPDVKQHTF